MFWRNQRPKKAEQSTHYTVRVECDNCLSLVLQPVKKGTILPEDGTYACGWMECPNCGVFHQVTREKVKTAQENNWRKYWGYRRRVMSEIVDEAAERNDRAEAHKEEA